ncbi:MAG: DUF262 domain-containing HNH endonuclease family protein [Limnohabitans sp.]|nr:DUF262 domain-containing HNH endonuclease family protein [Limnohabitans sp.]
MADLNVSKKTIGIFFSEMQNKKFLIPEYQRPYSWNKEHCETLWEDITNFADKKDKKDSDNYFLGTIVSCNSKEQDSNIIDIIDGQQRITSLMLLLRAVYTQIEGMEGIFENQDMKKNLIGLKNQIAPCIWDIDRISQEVKDKTKTHLESKVVTETDNCVLQQILEKGKDINEGYNSNYYKNYEFFQCKWKEFAENKTIAWENLCVTILHQCIVLPIACDEQDTALTIFSTLNDRGMPLTDADIFKAQIYSDIPEDQQKKRDDFIETWKKISTVCKEGEFSINDIFRYYTHFLRAMGNKKDKEIGLRKFYSDNKFEKLKQDTIITNIEDLAYFWRDINRGIEPENNLKYTITQVARNFLHCLEYYSNEFWKFPVTVFFLSNKSSQNFSTDFEDMLKKLLSFLLAKFIEKPSINAIKDDIYLVCIALYHAKNGDKYKYRFEINKDFLSQQIENYPPAKINKALLLLYAYLNTQQQNKITEKFDIEHIFPKKWQGTNYNGWEEKEAKFYLEKLGNKTVIEKRLNIQAGNGYFGKKKELYGKSGIETVRELSKYKKNDWVKEDIEERGKNISTSLIKFFKENLQ